MTEPTRGVVCATGGCENEGVTVPAPDTGVRIVCGPCGATLAEQADWYVPEPEDSPEPLPPPSPPTALEVADAIARMDPEERSRLIDLLAGGGQDLIDNESEVHSGSPEISGSALPVWRED